MRTGDQGAKRHKFTLWASAPERKVRHRMRHIMTKMFQSTHVPARKPCGATQIANEWRAQVVRGWGRVDECCFLAVSVLVSPRA